MGNAQLYMGNCVHSWHCQYVNRRCVTVKQDLTEMSTSAVLLSNRTWQRCQQAMCYCQTGPDRGVNRRCVTVKQNLTEVSTSAVLLSNRTQQRCQRNNAEEPFCPLLPGIFKRMSFKVPGFAHLFFDVRSIKMKTSKQHRWNDTVKRKNGSAWRLTCSSSTLSTINPTVKMCSFAVFPVSYADVTENKYIYAFYPVLVPICTVATAVSAMCQYGGTLFYATRILIYYYIHL